MNRLIPLILMTIISLGSLGLPVQAQGDLFARINNLRQSLGLSAYTSNGSLTAAAQNHAQWMIANPGVISHVQEDGSRPRDRAANAGYNSPWVGENIYLGGPASSLEDAWSFWMNSTIHYQQITNGRYVHIGIATQSDGFYTAYVLVFGAPNLTASGTSGGSNASNNNASSGSSSGGASAPAAPPSFIVGVDDVGNIMHEVQEGDTLGDIVLLYGYTWDDIPYMLEVNGLTEEDIRVMQVGSVFLVPPQSGTYTPTPSVSLSTPEATSEANPAEAQNDTEPTRVDPATLGVLPTLPPSAEIVSADSLPSPEATDILLPPPVVFAVTSTPAPTMTATPTPSATNTPLATATLISTQVAVIPSATATEIIAPNTGDDLPAQVNNGLPSWLIIGIIAQIGVLVAAVGEYIRRFLRSEV